jgi:hypothetical protein
MANYATITMDIFFKKIIAMDNRMMRGHLGFIYSTGDPIFGMSSFQAFDLTRS